MTSEDRESAIEDKDATNNPGDDIVIDTKHDNTDQNQDENEDASHASLKYSLLGPSLTKAGQDSVDQSKVGIPTHNTYSLFRGVFIATDKSQPCLLDTGIRDHI